jgi:hypothetical protein
MAALGRRPGRSSTGAGCGAGRLRVRRRRFPQRGCCAGGSHRALGRHDVDLAGIGAGRRRPCHPCGGRQSLRWRRLPQGRWRTRPWAGRVGRWILGGGSRRSGWQGLRAGVVSRILDRGRRPAKCGRGPDAGNRGLGRRQLAGAGQGGRRRRAGGGTGGRVTSLAARGNSVWVGGDFTVVGRNVAAARVARWDGEAWSALGEGADDYVAAIATDSAGSVYVGGLLDGPGGSARVARRILLRCN